MPWVEGGPISQALNGRNKRPVAPRVTLVPPFQGLAESPVAGSQGDALGYAVSPRWGLPNWSSFNLSGQPRPPSRAVRPGHPRRPCSFTGEPRMASDLELVRRELADLSARQERVERRARLALA